jgi:hypothetical protein
VREQREELGVRLLGPVPDLDGGPAAAQRVVVEDVVVQKAAGVSALEADSGRQDLVQARAEGPCAVTQQQGPQQFARGLQRVAVDGVDASRTVGPTLGDFDFESGADFGPRFGHGCFAIMNPGVSARSNRHNADRHPTTWLGPDNPTERCTTWSTGPP